MRSDNGRNPQANRRAAARRESPTRSDEHQQTLREANELMLKSAIRSRRNAERCFGGRSRRLCCLKEAGGPSQT